MSPWVRANVEDASFSPPITSYIAANQKMNDDGKMPLCVDFLVWSIPNAPVAQMSSSRNNRPGVDTFNPARGNTNGQGLFYTTMSTVYHSVPLQVSSVARADGNQNITASSPVCSLLPAKCRTTYTCSVYYVPKESGFTAAGGFEMTRETPKGMDSKYKFSHSFIKAVKEESFGRMVVPIDGKKYLAYHPKETISGVSVPAHYDAQEKVLGVGGLSITPRVSCAINAKLFPQNTKLITQLAAIKRIFGNDQWVVSDIGVLTNKFNNSDSYQFDLYWGEDDPMPNEPEAPKNCAYNITASIPVIVVDLP